MILKDIKGKELPAMTVFSESIRYLKEHLLEELTKKATTMTEEDIHWVLTVPAIWSDAAKQFMRESAVEVGTKLFYIHTWHCMYSVKFVMHSHIAS